MNGFTQFLQRFGVVRLVAVLGAAAGVAAVLAATLMHIGGEPQALLYSDLDLREAGQITQALDAANIPYESRGDGSTIMVPRDRVGTTRMMLASRGLPTSSSIGYELFDNASALGQTDFTQNLNRQRAMEGELSRDVRTMQGISSAQVRLVLPRRQLFEDQAEQPSASIIIGTVRGDASPEQIRAVRNYVAGAVPGLSPQRVNVVDTRGRVLAGGEGDGGVAGDAEGLRQSTEAQLRTRVLQLVEGIVGPGNARVDVSADIDTSEVTIDQRTFDPDGQVVRSTSSGEETSSEQGGDSAGATSASTNVPGGAAPEASTMATRNQSGNRQEVTNYEISSTRRQEVQRPGRIRRLSVAVAVNGSYAAGQNGRPGAFTPRTAAEIQNIDRLVKAAVGFVENDERRDTVTVTPVQFDREAAPEGGEAGLMAGLDKNDLMRAIELGVLVLVAGLIIFFVARPLLKSVTPGAAGAGGLTVALAGAGAAAAGTPALAGPAAVAQLGHDGAGAAALPAPDASAIEQRIDLARVEGQVKASSVKKVAEFVDRYPEESVSILRTWMQES